MGDVLQLDDVTVRRDGRALLDTVGWSVSSGERWAVLGPNGAGKTTLLRLAAAQLHPTAGTVRILGERLGEVDVFGLRPRLGLASAALTAQLPPTESVLDVVLTAGWAVTGRWKEPYEGFDVERARWLLHQLGIAHLERRTFATLSEGERKRAGIARALMPDPELLLLDEPAAGLDLGAREDLLARLGALAADPSAPALVLVTHHVEEVPAGTTHALLLREGRVVASGPVAGVLTAEALGTAFGLPLVVQAVGGRWTARAA